MSDYITPEAVLALGVADPEFAELIRINPVPPMPRDDIVALRKMSGRSTSSMPVTRPGEPITIAMRDGYSSDALVFKSVSIPPGTPSPLLVLIYGGGFIAGSPSNLAPIALDAADMLGATAVCISYRLAPEHPFPAAPRDVWDSLAWLAANAASLGADLSAGFVVGGVSSGANLAAVAAQQSLEQPLAAPMTGLWAAIPPLLHATIVPDEYKDVFLSREQNKNSPGLDEAALAKIQEWCKLDFSSAEATPFSAARPHVGMPRTYVQVEGLDPLRDDGLIYERELRKNGVQTRLDVYPGVPHGHTRYATLKSARKGWVDIVEGLAWLLGKEVKRDEIAAAKGFADY